MAKIADIVAGLEILAKTARIPKALAAKGETDGRQVHIHPIDHYIINGPIANPSDEDKDQLRKLGWHFDPATELWSLYV